MDAAFELLVAPQILLDFIRRSSMGYACSSWSTEASTSSFREIPIQITGTLF